MLEASRHPAPYRRADPETAVLPRATFELDVLTKTKALTLAIAQARAHLLGLRQADGHWCAELEGDTILESEYLMMLWFLGRPRDERFERACRYLRQRQLDEGGWSIYPGGPPEASPSVKAYFVLKLAGDDPDAPHMRKARESILRLGGVAACNSFTKILLSVFGVWRREDAPAVPPELILLPRWFYVNIYEMSSWSRAIVVPLAIIWAARHHCPVPVDLDDIILERRRDRVPANGRERFWFTFFRGVDRAIKLADRIGAFRPFRARALSRCEAWTVERFQDSAGLGAIFPSIMNSVMALRLRGYPEEHPLVRSQLEELEKLELLTGEPGDEALKLQPCCSPVWDTALTVNALLESGVPAHDPNVQQAVEWLLAKEVRQLGDWAAKCPGIDPGGWYFEYANEFYPDCDDTAEVLIALAKVRMVDPEAEVRRRAARDRAVRWMRAMQNRDGGWGAFEKDCNRELLTYVPFADHNAMIDPSTVDVTSRTIEALALHLGPDHPAVRRAVAFVEREQKEDGSWYGRWGSNYLYGTWLALCALAAVGRRSSTAMARGVSWLLSVQQADGGWGETLQSYVDPTLKGVGPTTAAQTSWAMLGLLAVSAGRLEEEPRIAAALERACDYLRQRQRADGGWLDPHWTGTGFPGVFYLRYHYYDRYFPLQALAAYQRELERSGDATLGGSLGGDRILRTAEALAPSTSC
jgi:squalene-hopene/tetraprenyl-beta-curcumene cyclase